mgnify:CR=1 FL=1
MIFTETKLSGAFVLELEQRSDERGFFARTFCQNEFRARGMNPAIAQCNVSYNAKKGTLRGMHFQVAPKKEAKLVRVTRGAILDVIVDLRPDSKTFRQWTSIELSADNRKALYIPNDFAHGFQTLGDDTEVLYQMSEFFAPDCARGLRWNDPVLGIVWPEGTRIIFAKDEEYPLLSS